MAITPNAFEIDGDSSILLTSSTSETWAANCGTLYTNSGLTALYDGVTPRTTVYLKPFNRTVNGFIQAGASQSSAFITGVFPVDVSYPMEWEGDKRGIVVSVSRSGRVRGRIVSDTEYIRDFKLVMNNRKQSEIVQLEEFHHHHYPDAVFIYRNKWYDIDGHFRFDSKLKGTARSRQNGTIEVAIAGVPFTEMMFPDIAADMVESTATESGGEIV
jgi:hypothetical protein